MWPLMDAAISAFDVYIITSFYCIRLEKRLSTSLVVSFSAFCAVGYSALWQIDLPAILYIISSVAICYAITLTFHASWKQRLYYPLVITTLAIVAEMAAGFMLSGLFSMTIDEITAEPRNMEFLVGKIAAKLIFFIFIRLLCRIHVMDDNALPMSYWLVIMLSPVTSVAVCVGLAYSSGGHIIQDPTAPFIILIGVLVMNVLAFMMYDRFSAQSKALVEHERSKNLMEADMRRYESMISQSREFAAMLHDTQKHRNAVYDLLVSGNAAAAISYMESLDDSGLGQSRISALSPNAAVTNLLQRNADIAKQNGIEFICNHGVESYLPIDEVTLCLVLGNALENAVEACLQLPEGEKKLIVIDIHYANDRLTIRIANTSKPIIIGNNTYETTKSNKMSHGYGLPNIHKAVAKKGGISVIRYENGMFILSVVFLL